MNEARRDFLKSLLGLAAAAVFPTVFEPLVSAIRAPGEEAWDGSLEEFTLSFSVSFDGSTWRRVVLSVGVPKGDEPIEFPVVDGVKVRLYRKAMEADLVVDASKRNVLREVGAFPGLPVLRVDGVRLCRIQLERGPTPTPFERVAGATV